MSSSEISIELLKDLFGVFQSGNFLHQNGRKVWISLRIEDLIIFVYRRTWKQPSWERKSPYWFCTKAQSFALSSLATPFLSSSQLFIFLTQFSNLSSIHSIFVRLFSSLVLGPKFSFFFLFLIFLAALFYVLLQ